MVRNFALAVQCEGGPTRSRLRAQCIPAVWLRDSDRRGHSPRQRRWGWLPAASGGSVSDLASKLGVSTESSGSCFSGSHSTQISALLCREAARSEEHRLRAPPRVSGAQRPHGGSWCQHLPGGTAREQIFSEGRKARTLLRRRATEEPARERPRAPKARWRGGERARGRAGVPEGSTYLLPQPHLARDDGHHVHLDDQQRAAEQEGREHLAADGRGHGGSRHLHSGSSGGERRACG